MLIVKEDILLKKFPDVFYTILSILGVAASLLEQNNAVDALHSEVVSVFKSLLLDTTTVAPTYKYY